MDEFVKIGAEAQDFMLAFDGRGQDAIRLSRSLRSALKRRATFSRLA